MRSRVAKRFTSSLKWLSSGAQQTAGLLTCGKPRERGLNELQASRANLTPTCPCLVSSSAAPVVFTFVVRFFNIDESFSDLYGRSSVGAPPWRLEDLLGEGRPRRDARTGHRPFLTEYKGKW